LIKALIFDWFGVCTKENWGDCVQRELVKELKVSPEIIQREFKLFLQDFMSNKLSPEGFFQRFIAALDKEKDSKKFHYLLEIVPDLNEELLDLILVLKKRYKIYLLSNTTAELFKQYQKKIDFKKYFDHTFLSHELKTSKTQDEIWEIVLSKVNFSPEELVFIDNKEKYLELAQKHGIKTILFKNNEQVRKELIHSGIQIT